MGLSRHKNAEAIDPTISCENISQIPSCAVPEKTFIIKMKNDKLCSRLNELFSRFFGYAFLCEKREHKLNSLISNGF